MTIPGPTLDTESREVRMPYGRKANANETLISTPADWLALLCETAGFEPAAIERATTCLAQVTDPRGCQRTTPTATEISDIRDHHSPIAFSIGFSAAGPQVRVLIEAQSGFSMSEQRTAALALTDRIAVQPGVNLHRFQRAAKLFVPEHIEDGGFALRHSICFSTHGAPSFTAYFNPKACGENIERELVQYALQDLGFRQTWPVLASTAGARGPLLDEVKYFALDLSDHLFARVQTCFVHHHATPALLASACPDTVGAEYMAQLQRFIAAMTKNAATLSTQPAMTCHSFIEANQIRPSETTVYLPTCANSANDPVSQAPVVAYLRALGIDPSPYQHALARSACRPTPFGQGHHSHAGTSVAIRARRLTTHLARRSTADTPTATKRWHNPNATT